MALALTSLYAVRTLAAFDFDATVFVAFGQDEPLTREYAEERLGDVFLRARSGHDGKFFFVQANDPFILHPDENAAVLDRPLYRSQRMFYPVLAGVGGTLSPEAIVWGMLIVNLLAMGLGAMAIATIAKDLGGSPWWGLAFALNVGFMSEMNIGGAGIVAAACAFAGVAMLTRSRWVVAITLLSFAALSREAMIIAALGSAWWLWRQKETRKALVTFAVPTAAVAVWAVYLRLRIDLDTGVSQIKEIGIPFVGFVNSIDDWLNDPIGFAVGFGMLGLFVLYLLRVRRDPLLVSVAFVGFVALGILFTERVWRSYFDITRAVAPLITAYVLAAFATRRPSTIEDADRIAAVQGALNSES